MLLCFSCISGGDEDGRCILSSQQPGTVPGSRVKVYCLSGRDDRKVRPSRSQGGKDWVVSRLPVCFHGSEIYCCGQTIYCITVEAVTESQMDLLNELFIVTSPVYLLSF